MTQTQPNQITSTHWFSGYTFSAKEKDEETGYSYFGARYYDSDISVWLSVDPMSDKYLSTSPFMYCVGNPVIFKDPNGKDPIMIDFSKVTNIENVLKGKQWVDYYDIGICGKAARLQAGKVLGTVPVYDGHQINMYLDVQRQTERTSKIDMQKGVDVIIENLLAGKPVVAGVMYTDDHSPGNNNAATNHFVTIVGMGIDENCQVYFSYYDNYASSEYNKEEREKIGTDIIENRFYYDEVNGVFYDASKVPINDSSHDGYHVLEYIITEIKENQ